jgi:hypothetical protein
MKQSILFTLFLLLLQCSSRTNNLEIEVVEAMRGSNCEFIWTQARAAVIPDGKGSFEGLMTLSQKLKSGDDVYYDLYQSHSMDGGKTWSEPEAIPGLGIHDLGDGDRRSMSDMTPQWHQKSGKVLNIGKSFFYTGDVSLDRSRREVAYAVFDPDRMEWGYFQVLELPEYDRDSKLITAPGSGCVQFHIEKNGEVFLPVTYRAFTKEQIKATIRETFEVQSNMKRDDIGSSVAVVRCSFDGEKLTFLELGNSLTVKQGRGLGEPSLVKIKEKWLLTMRSDKTAFVATSEDGLHYHGLKQWTFDDGSRLGSYNTQQHWAVLTDKLYLIYTRPNGKNDHVFRHRAPLYIARVDPEMVTVLKATERVCVSEEGVALGNFGVTLVDQDEVWVVSSEYHRDDSPDNKNRVWVAKLTE